MKIAFSAEMRRMDALAMEQFGIPEVILMENAGRAVADVATESFGGAAGRTICVFAGTGNNGGDAFAAARHLFNRGAIVKLVLVGETKKMSSAATLHYGICQRLGLPVQRLESERDWEKLGILLRLSDGVVDGLLGIGLKGALREPLPRLISLVNASGRPVVAIDVPSGVDADTGQAGTVAVNAEVTVTFGLPKTGQFFAPGASHVGRLVVDDISLPPPLLAEATIQQEYLDQRRAKEMLRPRPLDAHKGSCGRILAVAGSRGMTGAAALSADAILRAGAGIAVLAVAAGLQGILAAKLTEVMTEPLPESAAGILGEKALTPLTELAADYDAVLIGPGLGRAMETGALVRAFVKTAQKPCILDADALYAFVGHTAELAAMDAPRVLTPHLGEMAALLGITVPALRENLLPLCRKAAAEWQAILVVKSECTIVVLPAGQVFLTSTGNAGMATAGTGDVLSGAIAGLMQQTASPEEAALLGVYLHGAAGDLAAEEKAEGLVARDLLEKLPLARKRLKEANA
ncbi:MAG: NAD(P)H-hydrate dehydratase [Schwartzia sp. (in: firmicutes)]